MFAILPQQDLGLATGDVSASAATSVAFELDAGPAQAGRLFVLLGSLSGNAPCLPVELACVPLVPDVLTTLLLQPPAVGSLFGSLDGAGAAAAGLPLAAPLSPGAVGLVLYGSFVLLAPLDYASSPVAFEFAP